MRSKLRKSTPGGNRRGWGWRSAWVLRAGLAACLLMLWPGLPPALRSETEQRQPPPAVGPQIPQTATPRASTPETETAQAERANTETARADAPPAGAMFPMMLPAFERPPAALPIEGARRAVLVFATCDAENARILHPETIAELDAREPGWRENALRAAANLLATAEQELLRDKWGVIQAVLLRSEHPCFSGVIFSPELVERFEGALGPELLAVVPRQGLVVLFPGADARIEALAEFLLGEYRRAGHPVSEEVYRVSRQGVRAEGILRD